MRRRRKPRVIWLSCSNDNRLTSPAGTGAANGIGQFVATLTGPFASGDQVTAIVPVFGDKVSSGVELGLFNNSLSDQFASAYRLRRIVGKIFVGVDQLNTNLGEYAWVTAGLIVLRVDQTTNLPLGGNSDYSTQQIDNWSDPWIWRRTWLLSNNTLIAAAGDGRAFYPETNTGYGSVADGPHVDAKTARIVSNEERVFLCVTLTTNETNPGGTDGPTIRVSYDLRGVASLRANQGNRRNASR